MRPIEPAAPGRAPDRARYPSDVTDRQWARVSPLLPPESPRGRPRTTDLREVVNGLNYRWTTGCTWRMLPHDFPRWSTVYCHVRRWSREGRLGPLRNALLRRTSPRPDHDDVTPVEREGERGAIREA